jgi:hypothetical protein
MMMSYFTRKFNVEVTHQTVAAAATRNNFYGTALASSCTRDICLYYKANSLQ